MFKNRSVPKSRVTAHSYCSCTLPPEIDRITEEIRRHDRNLLEYLSVLSVCSSWQGKKNTGTFSSVVHFIPSHGTCRVVSHANRFLPLSNLSPLSFPVHLGAPRILRKRTNQVKILWRGRRWMWCQGVNGRIDRAVGLSCQNESRQSDDNWRSQKNCSVRTDLSIFCKTLIAFRLMKETSAVGSVWS